MTGLPPLPFRLKVAGEDTIAGGDVISIAFKVRGQAHLLTDALLLEWVATESVDRAGLSGAASTTETLPTEEAEIPLAELAAAEVRGRWWGPRLMLRSARLGTFDGLPGAKPGRLELRIRRRDLRLADRYAAALTPDG